MQRSACSRASACWATAKEVAGPAATTAAKARASQEVPLRLRAAEVLGFIARPAKQWPFRHSCSSSPAGQWPFSWHYCSHFRHYSWPIIPAVILTCILFFAGITVGHSSLGTSCSFEPRLSMQNKSEVSAMLTLRKSFTSHGSLTRHHGCKEQVDIALLCID